MKVQIGIPTKCLPRSSANLVQEFLESAKNSTTSEVVLCRPVPRALRHAFPGQDIVVLLFEFTAGVSAGLIANWLYDKLRDRGATIVIGRREVRIENAEKLGEIIIEQATETNE